MSGSMAQSILKSENGGVKTLNKIDSHWRMETHDGTRSIGDIERQNDIDL